MENLSNEDIRRTFSSLVDITLCAICLDTVRLDMIQCVNGHLLCAECRGDLGECPSCRGDFSDAKPSGLITQMIEALPPRCKHKNCGRYLKRTDDDHEHFCGFKQTDCRLEGCNWKGPGKDIVDHFRSEHGDQLITDDKNKEMTLTNFDLDEEKNISRAFYVDGHFFWHKMSIDTEVKSMTHSFSLIPNGKPKNEFFIKFTSISSKMKCEYKFKFNAGSNESDVNFITIPSFMLPPLVNGENKFCCNVTIKVKLFKSSE